MKKNILLGVCAFLVIGCLIFILTGCGESQNSGTQNSGTSGGTSSTSTKKPDHKIYKYMKMSSSVGHNLLYSASALFGDTSEVSNGDLYYKPCIIAEFDTETGKATKATFYTFFLDGEDDEWVNKAIEKYNNSSSESKKYYTNVKKGRINNEISYLTCDLEVNSNIFTQFIDTYIIESQDIEKYKDKIYYSRLYNYSSTPPHAEGANYFAETLEGIRIEWSDSEIKLPEKEEEGGNLY